SGKQDLIVHILAPHQRYEVANYDNIRIPTNIEVREAVKGRFAEFYTALYDRTVEKHPRAVVTEYAWDAGSCDPCPGPVLDQNDFLTLGADVLEGTRAKPQAYAAADFVLTRLHARYGKDLSDDLRFKAVDPIAGGRELPGGQPEEGSQPAPINNFQGRYILRHRWLGPLTCEKPVRGRWGGPEGGASPVSQPVKNAAFAKRGTAGDLAAAIVSATASAPQAVPASGATRTTTSSGCCQGSSDSGGLVSSLGLALWLVTRRRPGLARRR
ncbi:MAG: hypothetical protein ABI867_44320, partial [Kofleriaceae bacterium]